MNNVSRKQASSDVKLAKQIDNTHGARDESLVGANNRTGGFRELVRALDDRVVVGSAAAHVPGREAHLSATPLLTGPTGNVVSADAVTTRSALAGGRRWLAVDSGITPNTSDAGFASGMRPSALTWDARHQVYCWPYPGATPSLANVYPEEGDALTLVVTESGQVRVSVGVSAGYVRCPILAVTGGRRTRDVVGLYTCDSLPGDCGSLVYSSEGVVGLHAGTLRYAGRQYNAYYPFFFDAEPQLTSSTVVEAECEREGVDMRSYLAAHTFDAPRASVEREAGIVGMSPAPSNLARRDVQAVGADVNRYVELLMNPWASSPVRLPDHVVVPTSLARFVANRTYTFSSTGTIGPNYLFGVSNRLNNYAPNVIGGGLPQGPNEIGQLMYAVGGSPPVVSPYTYSPGCILTPGQWGLGGYTNPRVNMSFDLNKAGPWSDDYGSTLSSSTPFMSAYRTLSLALRVRIVGLPAGVFMTPGKIYFAQVRCDNTDLPITEQDFANLEQHGRASHVSADAVREAGSKTLYYAPDGSQKFEMTTNFLPPCGIFAPADLSGSPASSSQGQRWFPSTGGTGALPGTKPVDWSRAIIPYETRSDTSGGAGSPTTGPTAASGNALDSNNADQTTYLFMAYFGGQDGVVLEVDYATIIEYIPNRNAPGGVDAMVQLPDSSAMDRIFAAAAVLTEARPVLLQRPGDLTIGPGGASNESASRGTMRRLAAMGTVGTGSSYREGFWDFDWLKTGNLGPINWDFRDPAPPPAAIVASPAPRRQPQPKPKMPQPTPQLPKPKPQQPAKAKSKKRPVRRIVAA